MTISAPIDIAFPTIGRRPTATTPVTIYATLWNMRGLRASRALQKISVAHYFVDIDLHPDAKTLVRRVMGDKFDLPVVYVDGDWLMAPSLGELTTSLCKHGLHDDP